jgi:type IV fimbrial biogenesis protein FimT
MNTRLARRQTSRKNSRGLTLIEAMAAMATIAIAVGSALPSLQDARDRRHLEGAAAQLTTDLTQARSLAVSNGVNVRFNTQRTSDGVCYVVHTGAHGDCTCTGAGTAQCAGGAQLLRVVGFGTDRPLQFQSNSRALTFDSLRGTVTPTATMTVSSNRGQSLSKIVSLVGRVRTCSPDGTVSGYPAC